MVGSGPSADAGPVVAYVGGIGRSGSTLLCRLLAQVPGVVNVGEICYLWNQSVLNDRMCSCGVPFGSCPFWVEVGRQAFGGWDAPTATRLDGVRRRLERNRRLVPLTRRGGGVRSQEADEYAAAMDAVLRAVATVAGARVVVDNSKMPSTALIRRRGGLPLRVIHLVRSPFGVAHSWNRVVSRPDFDGRQMTRFPPHRAALDWSANNAAFDLIARLVPTLRMRYEDLVHAPREEVARALDFLGVPDPDLSFIGDGTAVLGPDHSVWGNPSRVSLGPATIRPDERWREELGLGHRVTVTALTAPGLARYGYLRRR